MPGGRFAVGRGDRGCARGRLGTPCRGPRSRPDASRLLGPAYVVARSVSVHTAALATTLFVAFGPAGP
jgi:hypothetical protein